MDPVFSVRMMGIWLKTKLQIMDMFPSAGCTPYARELEIFGMKPIWIDDWLTKLESLPSIERTVIHIHSPWPRMKVYVYCLRKTSSSDTAKIRSSALISSLEVLAQSKQWTNFR